MVLSAADNILYIIELSVSFETNFDNNGDRKYERYRSFKHELSPKYHKVEFVNVFISILGILGNSFDKFTQICNNLEFDNLSYNLMKFITDTIRSTFYIFRVCHKPWPYSHLLPYLLFVTYHYVIAYCSIACWSPITINISLFVIITNFYYQAS